MVPPTSATQSIPIPTDFGNLHLVAGGSSKPPTIFHDFKVTTQTGFAKKFGGLADIFVGDVADLPLDFIVPPGRVAVKLIRTDPKQANSRENVILALELAKDFSSMMEHPNVAPIFQLMSDNKPVPAVAVPWYDKGNVLDHLGRFPDADRLPMIKQLASSLRYLHSVELLHGNIVPANILIANDNSVRLTDVGLHACITKATYTGDWFIPSEWMYKAPEELVFECDPSVFKHTEAMDIYAFASSVYTMYTLKAPFPARSYGKNIPIILADGHGVLKRSAEIPLSCWGVIQGCWSHNPGARHSADTVVSSLADM